MNKRIPLTRTLFCTLTLAFATSTISAGELSDMATAALQNDNQLKVAAAQRNVVVESKAIAVSALYPLAAASASLTQTKVLDAGLQAIIPGSGGGGNVASSIDSYETLNYGASVQQSLFNWESFQGYRKSQVDVDQAELTYKLALQDLYNRLITGYFSVQSAQSSLEANQNLVVSSERELEKQRKALSAGLGTTTDVLAAEASLSSAMAAVINDRTSRQAAESALSLITGTATSARKQLSRDLPLIPPAPASLQQWKDLALQENLALLAAQKAVRSSELQRKAAYGGFLPKVVGVGAISSSNNSTSNNDVSSYYYGVSASLPLFSGGGASAKLRQADEAYKSAVAKFELTKAQLLSDVATHFSGAVSGIENIKAAQKAVQANEANVVGIEVSAKVGARSVTDSLIARNNLAQAQRNAYIAKLRYLNNLIALKADIGRLSAQTVSELDGLFTETIVLQ